MDINYGLIPQYGMELMATPGEIRSFGKELQLYVITYRVDVEVKVIDRIQINEQNIRQYNIQTLIINSIR